MSTKGQFEVREAWQTARALSRSVFEVTGGEGFGMNFKLPSEMQKACVAIMSNIADGYQAQTKVSIGQCLVRAEGFAEELRGHLFAALDGGCLTEEQFHRLQEECEKCRVQISEYVEHLKNYRRPRSEIRPRLRL
jgi:four helix bundle protein